MKFRELDIVQSFDQQTYGLTGTIVHVSGSSKGEWFFVVEFTKPAYIVSEISEKNLSLVEKWKGNENE